MDKEKISLKLGVSRVTCSNCGFERILHFTPDHWYGERVVSTRDGKYCAYVSLIGDELEENILEELTKICIDIFQENHIDISKIKGEGIVSDVYFITCDDINGQAVDNTPSWKCCNCMDGEMKEDFVFGEQMMDIEMPYVTHEKWNGLTYSWKKQIVETELIRRGRI